MKHVKLLITFFTIISATQSKSLDTLLHQYNCTQPIGSLAFARCYSPTAWKKVLSNDDKDDLDKILQRVVAADNGVAAAALLDRYKLTISASDALPGGAVDAYLKSNR